MCSCTREHLDRIARDHFNEEPCRLMFITGAVSPLLHEADAFGFGRLHEAVFVSFLFRHNEIDTISPCSHDAYLSIWSISMLTRSR